MPAIKLKKVTAQYMAEKERQSEKKKNLEDVADETNKKEKSKAAEEKKENKPYNFLDVELLWDKRKRTIPASEQKLQEWLTNNLEKKEEVFLSLPALYDYYAETCQLEGTNVVDIPDFNKHIRDKFGSCFGFKDTSPYKGLLKEKKKKEKRPRVQGETFNLKFKDIIEDVISSAGNPRKGLRFGTLKTAINVKYPALRVDLYPRKLKNALDRGIRFTQIELVKGVGMCGFYRLPGDPDVEEEPEKKVKKKSKSAEDKEDTTNGAEDKTEEKTEVEGEQEEEKKDTRRGRKSKKGDAETKEDEKDKEKKESTKPKGRQGKKKQMPKKKKRAERHHRSNAERHCNPERVEDVFPLAITYQSDPKEASATRIKSYIQKHYPDCNTERLKKSLENGISKGLWEQARGSGAGGSFRLLIDTFDPSHSDTMDDRICQAIVACHEPKQASALLLKKYTIEYHPHLNTEAKPHLFKHALERACNKGIIRQLSGIGATGTFQLVEQFFPSPAILAGDLEDVDSGEEEEEEDIVQEVYIPRATKRGRSGGRQPAVSNPKKRRR